MSDDLVNTARQLAEDKVQLIHDLKAAQDQLSDIDGLRRTLQKLSVPDALREEYERAIAAVEGLHSAGKEHVAERRKDAKQSWSQEDLKRLGLARPARKSSRASKPVEGQSGTNDSSTHEMPST